MTDNERFEIIGRVVSEHEGSKKHLGLLQAKAQRVADFLADVAEALRGGSGPVPAAWPAREDVVGLLSDMTATKTRIQQLEQQRRDLGV